MDNKVGQTTTEKSFVLDLSTNNHRYVLRPVFNHQQKLKAFNYGNVHLLKVLCYTSSQRTKVLYSTLFNKELEHYFSVKKMSTFCETMSDIVSIVPSKPFSVILITTIKYTC